MTWKEFLKTAVGRLALIFSIATLLMMLFYMPTYYLTVITPRKGIVLNDFVLNFFTPVDWSWGVFGILTVAVLHAIFYYRKQPLIFMTGVTTYFAVNVVRMITMYVFTLEPPPGMILLVDPISYAVYPETTFAKDLFFSGHVSSMLILVFIERNKTARWVKILGTLLMALFLAWQRVHYTVDILAAPVFTYLIFRGVEWLFSDLRPHSVMGQEGTKRA